MDLDCSMATSIIWPYYSIRGEDKDIKIESNNMSYVDVVLCTPAILDSSQELRVSFVT